ncbi:MAG TPA: histidine kinase, partial [Rhodobacteraceae bacterium]|nr:histidine kinase [Paracoccaceae bacterium]
MTLASRFNLRRAKPAKKADKADVVLGEDWDGPDHAQENVRTLRRSRGIVSLNRSPLARKIITFNLLALVVLAAGVLYLNPFRDSLVFQRERGLVREAEIVANVFETNLGNDIPADRLTPIGVRRTLKGLDLPIGVEVFVFGDNQKLLGETKGKPRPTSKPVAGLDQKVRSTLITDFLNSVWEGVSTLLAPSNKDQAELDPLEMAQALIPETLVGSTQVKTGQDPSGDTVFSVAAPIQKNGRTIGAVAMTSASGEIDYLVRIEREQVLQMFVLAILVSIGLSFVLASTIANPLS